MGRGSYEIRNGYKKVRTVDRIAGIYVLFTAYGKVTIKGHYRLGKVRTFGN